MRFSQDTYCWNLLLLLASSTIPLTSSLPLPLRRRDSVDTVANYMQTALQTYLAGYSVTNFHAISSGWQPITFAGTKTSLTVDESANSIFYIADQIQGATTTVSYSGMMTSFIQDMNVAMGVNSTKGGANSPEVTKAAQDSSKACYGGIATVTTQVSKEWAQMHSGQSANTTSAEFLQFAAQDPEYTQASDECQSAKNTYQRVLTSAVGDDFYIFSGALNNIEQLTTAVTLVEGLNMAVSDETAGVGNLGDGKYKPYYSFPTLNGTMSVWQANGGGAGSTPAFTWSSTTTTGSTTNKTSSGGAGVGFIWEDLSGSGAGSSSSSKSTSNVTSVGMTVSFGQISIFQVDYGLWNAPEVAEALQNPPDDIAKKGAPAFEKYYGSAEKPGPLASWKDQALVVYQPSFSVEFSSASEASSFHQTAASAGVCIFIICIGGSGSSSTSKMSYSTGSKFVTYNDTTNQAYLVGFTQKNFFPNQGPQDDSNWTALFGNSTTGTGSSATSGNGNDTTSGNDSDSGSTGAGDGSSDTDSSSTGDETSDSGSDTSSSSTSSTDDPASPVSSSPDSISSSSSSKNNGTSSTSPDDSSSDSSSTSDNNSSPSTSDNNSPSTSDNNSSSPNSDNSSSPSPDNSSSTSNTNSNSTSTNISSPSDTSSSSSSSSFPSTDSSSTSATSTAPSSDIGSGNNSTSSPASSSVSTKGSKADSPSSSSSSNTTDKTTKTTRMIRRRRHLR